MYQSTNLDLHQMILDNMELARRSARSYARKFGTHLDETTAEAFFLLTNFFLVDTKYYLGNVENYERTLRGYISRRLSNYFTLNFMAKHKVVEIREGDIVRHTDEEMIEFLSDVFRSDEIAFEIFAYLRDYTVFDLELIRPDLRDKIKKIRREIGRRLRRLRTRHADGYDLGREVDPKIDPVELYEEQLDAGDV